MKRKTQIIFFLFICTCSLAIAQKSSADNKKPKFSFSILRDSLDGKLDMSDFLISHHGFIPVIGIITEPAFGGFGGMLSTIFIQPNKHQEKGTYVPPNITMAGAGYTANNSWGFGAMREASLPKQHLKYQIGVAHGDINMDFYRELPIVGTQEFAFNFNATGGYGKLLRQIGKTKLFIGLEYFYLYNKIKPEFEPDKFPDFQNRTDFSDNLSDIGINLNFDRRDNVFTPDKGMYITADFWTSANWIGSDYNFENFHVGFFQYFQLNPKWVSGFRVEPNIQFGDAPFFAKPAITMRGVPMGKYQGDATYVLGTEQRYDWTLRWSSVVFGGLAKAPTERVSFSDSELIYSYGTGFRYLLARKFKLRGGIDVAWSNEDFGWYVVIGSAWNNRN